MAEEFLDFPALIEVYNATRDEGNLERYLSLPDFPEFVHGHYCGAELVEIAARHGGKIGQIVRADKRHGWMLMVKLDEYDNAATTLMNNAIEAQLSQTRRALLSLSKLAAIAGSNEVPPTSTQETLLDYQVCAETFLA